MAEEPLPEFGACLLGSINLAEFVKDNTLNFDELREAVGIAVKALNNVLDEGLELHPLQGQRDCARDWRQIGLGIMGWATCLIKLGVRYDSEDALSLADRLGETIAKEALLASHNLGIKYGAYPKFDKEKVLKSEFYKNHNIYRDISLRNSQLLTIAPTGTISTLLNISGGIEPIFAIKYSRTTKSLHDKDVTYDIYTPIVKEWMDKNPGKPLPDYIVDSSTISSDMRVRMQATWQKHIDASISSTVNLPTDTSVSDVANIYMKAWEYGCKGITIFRANCKRTAILSTDKPKGSTDKKSKKLQYDYIMPVSRKSIGITSGSTFCKKCACGTLYITVNRDSNGNMVEVFTHTSKGGICAANTNGLTRMVSLALRAGLSIAEIKDQLKGITCPACLKLKAQGKDIDGISCPDILSRTIDEFEQGNIKTTLEPETNENCPECGAKLEHSGGCCTCSSCGWSKC